MVWNPSRPADSDRIRLSAGLLRDNFQAIEDGNVPYTTISLEQQASFPPLANHNRLYGYLNATSGNTELMSVNNAGQIVYLTEGGLLGASNQNGRFSSIWTSNLSFDGLYPYSGQLMVTARGTISLSGLISSNYNLTVSKTGTGQYTLTIPAGVMNFNSYQVILTPQYLGGGNTALPYLVTKPTINPANPTLINIETRSVISGNRFDNAFEVIIVGGRP